jgi:MoxR-like ATPase
MKNSMAVLILDEIERANSYFQIFLLIYFLLDIFFI